jgi:hypothetical protein
MDWLDLIIGAILGTIITIFFGYFFLIKGSVSRLDDSSIGREMKQFSSQYSPLPIGVSISLYEQNQEMIILQLM